jgi:hypothetical protein
MISESNLERTFRIYVRREGGHFIGLCAEVRSIIAGSNVEEIVERTKALIARSRQGRAKSARIAVHVSESVRERRS